MIEGEQNKSTSRGAIAWMVHNRVTPNLLMLALLIGGIATYFFTIKHEVFPDFELDTVVVRVPYPGASPEEVERGIVLVVEQAISGIDGVKDYNSRAYENMGIVYADLLKGADKQKAYQDIQQEVGRIDSFPDDAEDPVVSLFGWKRRVLDLQIYGPVSEWVLRDAAELVRDQLLESSGISQVELRGARDYEILIELPQENLRAYNLTLSEVAGIIRNSSVEVPAGSLDTTSGELLVRVTQRRNWAREFAQIPIITSSDGAVVYLEDIANVREGFEESDNYSSFNGTPSIGVQVYRIGDQTPIGVSESVKTAMQAIESNLPLGVEWTMRSDRSDLYKQRRNLLAKNIGIGLVIVLFLLGLFLELRLAFWVMMGIPISFLGAILFLPAMDVSINMISLFAFIVALGIVVDDAIVAGENIYEYRQQGMGLFESAIQGARDVSVPIVFAVLTNIVAFIPLALLPGHMGRMWKVIPYVVCTVFALSLVESLFILPSHLAHTSSETRTQLGRWLHHQQQKFSHYVRDFIYKVYGPFLDRCVRQRLLTVAVSFAILTIAIGYIQSGRMNIILMPRVESDRAVVTAMVPMGSPLDKKLAIEKNLLASAKQVVEANGGDKLASGYSSSVGGNEVRVTIFLTDPDVRPMSTSEVTSLWREKAGAMPGLESLNYESDRGGPGGGAAINIELSHHDNQVLELAMKDFAERLAGYPVVSEIYHGVSEGKQQLDFKLKPEGESLGLNAMMLARQVRNAYQGSEAIKQQRGRNEVTVRVRRPKHQRKSEYDIEQLIIKTPGGSEVPLMDVASVSRGRAYSWIRRQDGKRAMRVWANVNPIGETSRVMASITDEVLPQMIKDYPGLTWKLAGRQADMSQAMRALYTGLCFALAFIYFLLAIPFRSYVQPIIVMFAIPFGIVGAVIGHFIMGYSLSVISMMGILALAGVVVNDSLVMVEYANRLRDREDYDAFRAIHEAGVRRFRPIMLTTLTTFGGLSPMIFETSRQARFMVPMAISLGYGIVFATAITLVLVPSLYMIVEDIRKWVAGALGREY